VEQAAEPFDLSPAEAAQILDVHVHTLKRWVHAGKVTGWRTPGGHWRFRRSDIEALFPRASESERASA
jgi:excisionase family DNA binding protein